MTKSGINPPVRQTLLSLGVVLLGSLLISSPTVYGQVAPPAAATPPASETTPAPSQFPDAPSTANAPAPASSPTGPTVVLDTSMGRLTCKLFSKEAPLATANFITLAEGTKDWTDPATGKKVHSQRFYDGTTFHRVIPGFMIQGGDHRGDGTGDAGYFFDNENTPGLIFDIPGRLAMANAGPNTNGTQFFVTEVAQPDLDGKYTIFGQCDAHSVLIAATIARVERNRDDKPLTPVTLTHVTVVRDGQPLPPAPAVAPPASSAPSVP